jgi:hypothetical protein
LPVAVAPLWQLAHVPMTLAWSKRTSFQRAVVWQSSQVLEEGMWSGGLCVLESALEAP